MKNIILVTGGAGFVGSNLISFLLKKTNFKIISLDNYFTGNKKNHIINKRVKYINGENANIEKILHKYTKKICVIFHFGEFSRIYQSFLQIKKCLNYNLSGSFQVINYAAKNKIKIIYSASSSVIGNKGKDQNLSPYAWTKAKNIELIKNFSSWYKLKYEIVYFYNVYGPGQILNSHMSAVIGIFQTQYKKNKPLTVVKPGTQKRDFTHISDIVNGCYLAWKKGKQNEYMLGTSKQNSILGIAKMFKSKIKFLPPRKGERFGTSIPNNLAYTHLGYKPRIDIKDYINNFINK